MERLEDGDVVSGLRAVCRACDRRGTRADDRDLLEKDGFDAAFVGTGAGLPKFMGIPGENLVGVFSANEYLTRANLMKA